MQKELETRCWVLVGIHVCQYVSLMFSIIMLTKFILKKLAYANAMVKQYLIFVSK